MLSSIPWLVCCWRGRRIVQTSEHRILTTHAGSLPRSPELQALHARKFAGEPIDEAALAATADAAMRDDGGQADRGRPRRRQQRRGRPRELLHLRAPPHDRLRRREPAAGDGGPHPLSRLLPVADAGRAARRSRQPAGGAARDRRRRLHRPQGDRRGVRAAAVRVGRAPRPLRRGVRLVAVARDRRGGDAERPLPRSRHLRRRGGRPRWRTEYAAIVEHGFVLQIDAPDLAMERHTLFQGKPIEDFLDFVRVVVAAINRSLERLPTRSRPPARLLGQLRRAARRRRAARGDLVRDPQGAAWAACSCRWRIRATSTSGACSRTDRCPRAGSSSPA